MAEIKGYSNIAFQNLSVRYHILSRVFTREATEIALTNFGMDLPSDWDRNIRRYYYRELKQRI